MPAKTATQITRRLDAVLNELELLQRRLARMERAAQPAPTGEFWIGDETDTTTLAAMVLRACQARPRSLQDLVTLTGARRNRISGVIYRLQFDRKARLQNRGTKERALWWSPADRAR